jgi:hypothetical protein
MSNVLPINASDAPPSSSNGDNPAVDLKEQLKQLQQNVQDDQDKIAATTKDLAGKQQDISVLQAGITDTDQTVTAYSAALKAAGDTTGFQKFIEQQQKIVTAAVGAGMRDLDTIITTEDNSLQTLRDKATKAQASFTMSATAYATAQKSASDAQTAYDDAKSIVARFQGWFAELKNLKTQVTAASDAGTYGAMYVLVKEMQPLEAKVTSSPSPDGLRKDLNTKLSRLQQAKKDLRDQKVALDQATAGLAAAQKARDGATANRRADLLKKVKDWKPPDGAAPKQQQTED